MKLLKLSVQSFGALNAREFVFNGGSAVLYGENESGKTAFIDAATSALYGLPRGNTSMGKEFLARYGSGPSASATLMLPEGGEAEFSARMPIDSEDWPPELFRTLLAVRCGDAVVKNTERNFTQIFTARVLGGGEVDLRRAMADVKKLYLTYERNVWHARWLKTQENITVLRGMLQKAAEMEQLSAKKLEVSREIDKRWADARALMDEQTALAAEKNWIKFEAAKQLATQLASIDEELRELQGLDRSTYAQFTMLNEELAKADRARAQKAALLSELESAMSDTLRRKTAVEESLSSLSSSAARERLTAVVETLRRKDEMLQSLTSRRRGWAIPIIISVLCAVLAYLGAQALNLADWARPAIALLTFAAALLIAKRFDLSSGLAEETRQEAAAAEEELHRTLLAMGPRWETLSPESALTLAARDAQDEIQQTERLSMLNAMASRSRDRIADEQAQLNGYTRQQEEFASQLEADMKRLHVTDMADLSSKIERLEYLHRTREDLQRRLTMECDLSAALFYDDLKKRLAELETAVSGTPRPQTLRHAAEAEDDLHRAEHQLSRLSAVREQLLRELGEVNGRLNRLEGELGKNAADVFAELNIAEREASEISLWRQAAEETYTLLGDIAKAHDEMMKNCVDNASPLFAEMTEGRYTGLELVSPSPFEPGSIMVRHARFGQKPLEWLSTGARDLLWLSVRAAFAASAYKTPSFMVLDEPFIALDRRRMEAAVSAMAKGMLKNWQFLILTKDEHVAEAAERAGMARFNLAEGSGNEVKQD